MKLRSKRIRLFLFAIALAICVMFIVTDRCIPSTAHGSSVCLSQTCDVVLGFDVEEYRCGTVMYSVLCWWEYRQDPRYAHW